jgi:hypothetical protein
MIVLPVCIIPLGCSLFFPAGNTVKGPRIGTLRTRQEGRLALRNTKKKLAHETSISVCEAKTHLDVARVLRRPSPLHRCQTWGKDAIPTLPDVSRICDRFGIYIGVSCFTKRGVLLILEDITVEPVTSIIPRPFFRSPFFRSPFGGR